jgi:hypothetical protein
MVVLTYNSSIQEAEKEVSQVQGQPELHSEIPPQKKKKKQIQSMDVS